MKKNKIFVIVFFILAILAILTGCGTESEQNKKPDEIELMTYAQMVLEDNLYKPTYSSYKGDYEFIGTGLRYKIEGKVNGEKFWMVIEFVDETYEEYDLLSLQVGNKKY